MRNSANPSTEGISLHIPMKLRRYSGRKEVIVPEHAGAAQADLPETRQEALAIALARAHIWQRALESGHFKNIQHIARELDLDSSYVGRILRLALLPPWVQEGILDGTEERSLEEVLGGRRQSVSAEQTPILSFERQTIQLIPISPPRP